MNACMCCVCSHICNALYSMSAKRYSGSAVRRLGYVYSIHANCRNTVYGLTNAYNMLYNIYVHIVIVLYQNDIHMLNLLTVGVMFSFMLIYS